MRPCPNCGQPVANNQTYCESCQLDDIPLEEIETHRHPKSRTRVSAFNLLSLLLEMLLTALIIGIPVGVICTLVALFFFPNWWAVYYGFMFGLIAGVIFWLLGAYFFSQSIHRPLQ